MIELTQEQQKAYDRYIAIRNKVGIVRVKGMKRSEWIPLKDYLLTVDVTGLNHPLFMVNDDWMEYKEAFLAWMAIEPEFRHEERMRMSRGDYGLEDSWEERGKSIPDSYTKFKG
jgi:hypothetical protein